MGYIVIENFKFGLDTRRLDLNSRPGVLTDLINAHIDQGGQVEKRKAFVRTSLGNPGASFGLEALKDSLVVFGSGADPGGWPANVTFQRLQHPDGSTALSAIVASTVYNGKAFVIATFLDTRKFIFYDGTLLPDSYLGLVLSTSTSDIATQIALAITTQSSGLYTWTIAGPVLNVYGLPGRLYTIAKTIVSSLGTITIALVDVGIPGNPAVAAAGTFQIVTGTELAGHYVSQVAVGVTNLLTAPGVLYNDSPERTASDVALAIAANSGGTGYTATANGRNVLITAVATGTTANDMDVTITTTADVCIGLCKFNFVGSGFSLDYVQVDGVNIMTAVLNYPTPPGETITQFCVRIVANINANSGVSGYLSASEGNSVFLSKVVTKGSDLEKPVSVSVTPTTGTGQVFVGDVAPFIATISPTAVLAVPGPPQGREQATAIYQSLVAVVAIPVGGVPPYTFLWSVSLTAFRVIAPTSASTTFSALLPYPSHGGATATCEVRDSSGLVANPQVTINW